jgi:uncharacterized membrane protein YqjE
MSEPTTPGPSSLPTHGLSAEVLRLFGSFTRHLQALVALAGLEGREAATTYARGAIALGVTLFFAAFGYVFLLLTVAFALDHFAHIDWVWIALGIGVLHVIGAVAAGAFARKSFAVPVFRGTAEEIRRDVAALRPTGGKSTPLSP